MEQIGHFIGFWLGTWVLLFALGYFALVMGAGFGTPAVGLITGIVSLYWAFAATYQ